eukprot:UN09066
MISQYYGDAVTNRTGAHMLNHINEGLYILNEIGATENAKLAYIVHPLIQTDTDLSIFFNNKRALELIPKQVLALAIEYRNIASAHLSFHPAGVDSFNKSPLEEVNR